MGGGLRIMPPTACGLAFALAAVAVLPGCVDGGALVQAQQDETELVRLDEIDMGEYRITLPPASDDAGGAAVEFHIFGQVAMRDRAKVAEDLALNSPELRYRILLLVRSMTRAQLDEPGLETLRSGIAKLANAALDKKLIKNVGFYTFSPAMAL